jgi:hypothetical protein
VKTYGNDSLIRILGVIVEGWEWIGLVTETDGKTQLLDPYRLMVFRFSGRGKVDIRRGVEAMRDGRRRWNVKGS